MSNFKAGEQAWVLIEEDDDSLAAVDPAGGLETVAPVTVLIAPATVLGGGAAAQLTDGREIELSPERTFHTVEEAERAAEAFTG